MSLVLSTDFEVGLEAKATAKGLSVEDYLKKLVARDDWQFRDDYVELPPDEWIREFDAWADSHRAMNLPSLSDEAISREFIYKERGL